mmetsp:Transcript_19948/g.36006  ORF Transcript_19948/g.36006 Transcript_19948/m.36006 type:complete len:121 (-) Transcript_19948:1323-1685(-)
MTKIPRSTALDTAVFWSKTKNHLIKSWKNYLSRSSIMARVAVARDLHRKLQEMRLALLPAVVLGTMNLVYGYSLAETLRRALQLIWRDDPSTQIPFHTMEPGTINSLEQKDGYYDLRNNS